MGFKNDIHKFSNQELFSQISNKKRLIETLQQNGKDSKTEEIEFCWLVREKQKRFHNKGNNAA